MTMDYSEFLQNKGFKSKSYGIEVSRNAINPVLFDYQIDIVLWALRKGRALAAPDTGLGKTLIQLEWARLISKRWALIVAPLSVTRQTIREAKSMLDIDVKYVRQPQEVDGSCQIYITNYEMSEGFLDLEGDALMDAIVLDESSILKGEAGKYRQMLTKKAAQIPYRLCCTATPAPNDHSEIGMHAEYLGIRTHNEMLAEFFINANKIVEDHIELENGRTVVVKKKLSNKKGQEWRLRNYGKDGFYKWLATWAVMMNRPSDLGYDDDGFILPPLNIKPEYVDVRHVPNGQIVRTGLGGVSDRAAVRKATLDRRVKRAADLVNGSDDQWIVWCGLVSESNRMAAAIPDAVEVEGSHSPEFKAKAFEDFQDGKYRVLITKPSIAGFGMNFQNSHKAVFVGLGDSWESYYQCIRRQWRFGQSYPVDVHIVLSDIERAIYKNIMRKEEQAKRMKEELISEMKIHERAELGLSEAESKDEYIEMTVHGDDFVAMLGDSAKRMAELEDESVDVSVYSPPFADLYTYSNSSRDLGNSRDNDEFIEHYKFIIREKYRVHKPGTVTCVHTADIPALKMKDGFMGLKDFPGLVIQAHIEEGWIYHGWAVVSKNPQAQAIRTNAHALMFKQFNKDSSQSRPAILDRVLFFRKPGNRHAAISPPDNGEADNETWIDWAGGIWTGIHESDTLQYTRARAKNDEKHICPLQLGTIERCIIMYSNPGETVLDMFGGIGSTGYKAIKMKRRAIYMELKKSYFDIGLENLRDAERQSHQLALFDFAALQQEAASVEA